MAQHGRGAFFDMGDGDDVMVGTDHGDGFIGGRGTNWIDGGAQNGTYPDGNPASDSVDVYATSLAARDTISFQALSAGSTGLDAQAFGMGYQFKIVAGDEIDYVKNVEFLAVHVWTDKDNDGERDYDTEISDVRHFALDPNQQGVIVVGQAP